MAYVAMTLKDWVAANPDYDKFPGTVSGKPLIYQLAEGSPSLLAEDWFVWNWITEFPDISQSPATADISATGNIDRSLIAIVPDAPAASEILVNLGEDTDLAIDSIEGLVDAYQTGLAAGKKFYLGNFMGIGKKSEIYQASVAWTSGLLGAFPDPVTTNIAVTPNLGGYHKYEAITNA